MLTGTLLILENLLNILNITSLMSPGEQGDKNIMKELCTPCSSKVRRSVQE